MLSAHPLLRTMVPLAFVLMWSTGFIFTRMGIPYAEPLTFLWIRLLLAAVIILIITRFIQVTWPRRWQDWGHNAVVGILIHGIYLGGVFIALDRGVDTALTALIVGLQPLLTVILAATWLAEKLSLQKLLGVLLGLAGISLIVVHKGISMSGFQQAGLWFCVGSLFGISIGTLYQKRFCQAVDLLPATFIHYAANGVFLGVLVWLFESAEIQWEGRFVFALIWLIIVLSLGAVMLFLWLIRQGEASKVASLFYLVPPVVAIEAWWLFDEPVTWLTAVGTLLCVGGVALVQYARA
ncbi:MAG: DMT family transporter [Gammaproteobacteria bacterium]|nr:DMT family transporter [Gammaproteobacteria bacterium]